MSEKRIKKKLISGQNYPKSAHFFQQDFIVDSALENGHYASFLEYFKNEHGEEGDFLIKQYKENMTSARGEDPMGKELQLVFKTVLILKDNYLQAEDTMKVPIVSRQDLYDLFIDYINSVDYDKDMKYFDPIKSSVICIYKLDSQLKKKISKKDFDCLSEKLSISVNDSNSLYVKDYIDDILTWYTDLNTALLRSNSKKPKISPNCSYKEKQMIWSNSYNIDKISEQQFTSDTIYSFVFRLIKHINDNLCTLFGEIISAGSAQRKRLYKLLGLNKKKSTIGHHCDLILCNQYDYVHLVGEVSRPPSRKLPNKESFDLGRNNCNAKDEKSLCELAIVAEFGPILEESDLDVLLNELYIFMIQVKKKTVETSVLDHIMQKIYRSRLLNQAELPLDKKITDKVNFLQFLFTIYELIVAVAENANKLDKLMNKLSRQKQEWNANNVNANFDTQTISNAAKKLVLFQEITLSTPSSSPSGDDTSDSPKASLVNLLDFFITLTWAKETLREMNSIFSLEQVFATNTILLTPDHSPISADDDDSIPDIQI
ncbi:23828_t:CDS:10 [Racocetra persica]|uniref:23828_t:CDS:1 n=1 Tax=Racocetra persica TaxID=160502 RepID=A0ACA9L644_9GLOM|nr:23828_t:CDS:10 [Racocetra persica]